MCLALNFDAISHCYHGSCSYQQFRGLSMSILLSWWGIVWKQITESWYISLQQWVLYMTYYMVRPLLLLIYIFFFHFPWFTCCLIQNLFTNAGRKGVQGAEPGPALSWNQRVKIAYGAAKGLEFLHEKVQPPIVHRDIRSSNVLLFDDFQTKIADFNLSNQSSDTAARLHSTRVLGTFGYHAPE